ncbi:MAG: hypothetical protein Q9228_002762, partial [Teloschistes exilis]
LQPLIASLRRLESQFQENISVQKEFSNLSDDSKIYKLVGPVLLKQEKAEAESAVEGRLGWIEGEIKRVSSQIEDLQSKSEKKKMEVSETVLNAFKSTLSTNYRCSCKTKERERQMALENNTKEL